MKRPSIFAACALVFLAAPQTRPAQQTAAPQLVQLPNTQLLHRTSAVTGREYDIFVHLPGNYDDPRRRYPVIYLLDAQWDFPLLTAIYGQQYYDGFIPAAIIVGITWGGVNPPHDSLRSADLSPTHNKVLPQSGNGPKFLSFIKTELIPMIDSAYRTVPDDRTLVGSSFGGLFTLYALFEETALFRRYVLTSPPIGWDNGAIATFEKEYAASRSGFPVRVYIAEGALEGGVQDFTRYVARLASQGYTGMELHTGILEGMGHSGSKAEGFTRGLQAVFAKPSLTLDNAVLGQYAGVYELRPGVNVTLKADGGRLVVQTADGEVLALNAATERDFYVRGQFMEAHFEQDGAGRVTGFRLEQYSREQFVRKLR